MSGATTIDQSGTLASLYTGANVIIQQDSNSPTNGTVVVAFNTAVANVDLLSTFTVQDAAVLQLGGNLSVNALDRFIIGQDGTLDLAGNVSVGVLNDISFASGATGGLLVLGNGVDVNLLSNIAGFAGGDSIDLAGAGAPLSATSYTDMFNGTDTNFTVDMAGGGTKDFALAGNMTADPFSMSSDGAGGLLIADTACFAARTRILTQDGEIPVERLGAGDLIILADGTTAPVTFIGHRLFNLARHPRPEAVRPVRITAGALADGVPCRDLILSPDHALLLDGVLVQAKDLLDGVIITQDFSIPEIRYYHVELPTHGILLAEGAPAESYLDTGHRGIFDNADEPLILHPDLMQMRREAESIAPLCTDGPQLAAIRARLHQRKLQTGLAVEINAAIRAYANGTALTPSVNRPDQLSFHLPPGTRRLTLQTPVFIPADFDPASTDRRRLGLAIRNILADNTPLPMDAIDSASLHPQAAGDTTIWTKSTIHLHPPENTKTLTLTLAARPKQWRQTRDAA